MRTACWLVIGIASSALSAVPACADHAPVLVIPGRPGIPVVINGYDASYTIVEGDWGLSRPGHRPPAIVSGPLVRPAPYYTGAYFPFQGRPPGYGRREIEPPPERRLPRSAPSYHRSWGAESQNLPATIDPPTDPPPVILATPDDAWPDRRRHYRRNGQHRGPRDRR